MCKLFRKPAERNWEVLCVGEMPSKSRKVVVVKSLKDLSPRKSLLVSRAPQGEHETSQKLGSRKSNFGNHSPSVSVAVLQSWR